MRGPDGDLGTLAAAAGLQLDLRCGALDSVSLATALRFEGYLKRQETMAARHRATEHTMIPVDFVFARLPGLSREVVQRLSEVRPETLGQAGRIPGMTPAAIAVIAAHVSRCEPRPEAG